MTNDFQPFKQSGFEFVQDRHFAALFLTIENAGRVGDGRGERRLHRNSSVFEQPLQRILAGLLQRRNVAFPSVNCAD